MDDVPEYGPALSFDHISPTKFEEFCYDLLYEMGFVNLSWRKGTGYDSSPSDQGRDIQCKRIVKDIDNQVMVERWFVEVKHHKSGVSPSDIQGALAWAQAERPNKLLIITSNYLSNPCKNYISAYENGNRPSFLIKKWELKDLEKLVLGHYKLLTKYNLYTQLDFIQSIHPVHSLFSTWAYPNSLEYFFEIVDGIPSEKRDEIFYETYLKIINPKFRSPISGNETLKDLRVDDVDYRSFRTKCFRLKGVVSQDILVKSIMHQTFAFLFQLGNLSEIQTRIASNRDFINNIDELEKYSEGDERSQYKRLKGILNEATERLPEQTKHYNDLYQYFCLNVGLRMIQEYYLQDENIKNITDK